MRLRAKKSKNTDSICAGDVEADDALLADIWGFASAAKTKGSSSSGVNRSGSFDDYADDDDQAVQQSSGSGSSAIKQANPKKKALQAKQHDKQSPPVKKQKLGPHWAVAISKLQIDVDGVMRDLANSPSGEFGIHFSG